MVTEMKILAKNLDSMKADHIGLEITDSDNKSKTKNIKKLLLFNCS